MLLDRYLASNKNIPAVFEKIVGGAPPEKFNVEHLKAIGFGGSNDRAIVPLLKELGFLTGDGTPTPRYKEYRDKSKSKAVMAEALREAYSDLFAINENLSSNDKDAVTGRFKAVHGVEDDKATRQAATFFALLKLADLSASKPVGEEALKEPSGSNNRSEGVAVRQRDLEFSYNIQIQLPATRDIEIYNAIFRAIRENLMD